MHRFILAAWIGLVVLRASAGAQATQPASDQRREYRAGQAFATRDYRTALRLYREFLPELKDRPAKVPAIQDRIKACEQELAKAAQASGQSSTGADAIPTAPDQRKIHPPPTPGQVLELAIKELGNFEYDPDKGRIPNDVQRLTGSKIRLHGFMIPSQAKKITQFALVPSLFSCCFGQPPTVQHIIVCVCPQGTAVEYSPNQVIVEGTLTVCEKKDDGYVISIFQLAATSIVEAPREAKPAR